MRNSVGCLDNALHPFKGEALPTFKGKTPYEALRGVCHVWTPPVLQGENRFETAVELAVMYPAFSLRYADRWP